MQEYRPVKEGKARKVYGVGEGLVMVTIDRISVFDVIPKDRITDKGAVLAQPSCFWSKYTKDAMPNHMISTDTADMSKFFRMPELKRRSMFCKKLIMLPIEYVVHGYVTGSSWESCKKNGTVCDIQFPAGLWESGQLPELIFTPSTKMEIGDHDENTDFACCIEVFGKVFPGKGREYAETIRDKTLALYRLCADYARTRGIVIADMKFEFGLNEVGEVILADEMLTPDSSRFWPLEGYAPGKSQSSFDKQFVRDWLKANPDSDYKPPQDITDKTIVRHKEVYAMFTGKELDRSTASGVVDCKKESRPESHHFHVGDVARYTKFYELRSNLASDSTLFESLLWRKYFDARVAVLRDDERELGLFWPYDTEDEPYVAMPLAREEDLSACFATLQWYFRGVLKKPLTMKLADEDAVCALQLPEDQYLVEEEENATDHLYDGNAFRALSGRKPHKKKNHHNNSIKNYGERYTYHPLEPGGHEAVLRFLEKWRDGKEGEVEDHLDREVEGIHDLLNHGKELDLGESISTGTTLIDGELATFSVGSLSRRDNMAVTHIEKANPEIDGLYQAIDKEFLRHAFPETAIINREDDVGLEGLWRSRQSYYPCGFTKKYLTLERKGADLSDRQIQAEMQY